MNETTGTEGPVQRTKGTVISSLAPEFVSVRDASLVLNLERREVYRLMERNELAFSQYGRRRLIDPASLKDLIARIKAGKFAKAAA